MYFISIVYFSTYFKNMNRILFYISIIFIVINVFCTITAFNAFNAIVAIGLFIQLLTYDFFKPYRDEIKNIYLGTLQWFRK